VDWWGGDPKDKPVFDPRSFDIEELKKLCPTLKAGADRRLYQNFLDIIELCGKNGIKLILYTAPESPVFTRVQKDRFKIKDVIVKTAERYNLRYLDFSVDGDCYSTNLDRLLFDSQHVRDAEGFSQIFLDTIQKRGVAL